MNERRGPNRFSLFSGDLNSFKAVNTVHGLEGGDAAIRRVGQVLQSTVEPFEGVVAYRQSGDEFAIISPARSSEKVAAALRRAFKNLDARVNKDVIELSGSFGYCDCDTTDSKVSIEEWKDRSETALSVAKKQGAGAVVAWTQGLKRSNGKLRKRCSSCSASFEVTPTKPLKERQLYCPQCGKRD